MSKYEIKEFEVELNSKDFPQLSYQQFEAMVEKTTRDFVEQMTKLNAQFIALQDFSPLQVATKFYFVAGCAAVRRLYQNDVKAKNHYVRLEASALIQVEETDALLPGEKPLGTDGLESTLQGRAN